LAKLSTRYREGIVSSVESSFAISCNTSRSFPVSNIVVDRRERCFLLSVLRCRSRSMKEPGRDEFLVDEGNEMSNREFETVLKRLGPPEKSGLESIKYLLCVLTDFN
jgi:hypothetical protein